MNDTERLLNSTFPFIEDLLKKYGEFFPLASAVQTNDSIANIGTYDGNEHPKSNKVISDIKKGLRDGAEKGAYRTIAIFYDVKVIDPNTNQKTDAIAIFVDSKNDITAFTFFYPYKLTMDKQLKFSESWKNLSEKEIFTK